MAEIKEPIRIRRKKLTNGNVSLYLDIYLNGKREYEFLKLYQIQETTLHLPMFIFSRTWSISLLAKPS